MTPEENYGPRMGTAEHAEAITRTRHPGVQTALAWLAYAHLPAPLQRFSAPLYEAAVDLLHEISADTAELTTALNRLVEAKDWAVRAGVRNDTGRPGPVPRPQTIVDPPHPALRFEDLPSGQTIGGQPLQPGGTLGNFGAGQARPRPIRDNPQA